jgi:hypothetical protein
MPKENRFESDPVAPPVGKQLLRLEVTTREGAQALADIVPKEGVKLEDLAGAIKRGHFVIVDRYE